MTAYPVLLLSRRLTAALNPSVGSRFVFAGIGALRSLRGTCSLTLRWCRPGTGGGITTQSICRGFRYPSHELPRLAFGASFVLMLLLSLLPTRAVSEAVPATLWAWTWIGGIVANAFFFDRPTVALVGGVAMAVVTVPYLWLLANKRGVATTIDPSIREGVSGEDSTARCRRNPRSRRNSAGGRNPAQRSIAAGRTAVQRRRHKPWTRHNDQRPTSSPQRGGNIERCLPTLLSLHGATEILVLDDQSTDDTAAIAKRLVEADPRAAVLQDNSTSIPPGWLGKSWACERLAQAAKGTMLAFVDADVTLDPGALVSAVRLMRELNVDMICPYPEQLTSTPLTRLVQPLLQWSWLTFIPVTTSMDRQLPSMAVGNGQFAVFNAPAYRSVGGHAAVAGDVLEDVGLARAMRRAGYRTAVVDGSAIAKCRMYETDRELVDGYTKSLWAAIRK